MPKYLVIPEDEIDDFISEIANTLIEYVDDLDVYEDIDQAVGEVVEEWLKLGES